MEEDKKGFWVPGRREEFPIIAIAAIFTLWEKRGEGGASNPF